MLTITAIAENSGAITAAFHLYRCDIDHELRWAGKIVAAAKGRICTTEGRFRTLCYDHRELAQAIRCEVLLDYVQQNEQVGFLDTETAEQLRSEIESAFYPAPPELALEQPTRRMEHGEVFIEIMNDLKTQFAGHIIADGERFVKNTGKNKTFACWRTVSDERFLCIPEEVWATHYLRACKAAEIDVSFSAQANWQQKIQKLLAGANLIRYEGGGNYRHRLDLYGTGKKDTHVVLIPGRLLEGGEVD